MRAMEHGIIGYSGKQGDTCSDRCHNPTATLPSVRFEGPQTVKAEAVATFRFILQSQSTRQKVAGFNVAASDGVLDVVAGQGEHVELDELTHDAAKQDVDGIAAWEFSWRAPTQTGVSTLYGAGLSANGNGTNGGDDSNLTTLAVTVIPGGEVGDANCDARLSAADMTAVVQLLPSGATGTCSRADADGDGGVDTADLALVVAGLFGG